MGFFVTWYFVAEIFISSDFSVDFLGKFSADSKWKLLKLNGVQVVGMAVDFELYLSV